MLNSSQYLLYCAASLRERFASVWPSLKLVFKTMLDKNTPKNADFSTLSDLAENWRISSLNFYQSFLKVWTKNINQKPLILIFFILKCQNSAKPNRTFILAHPVLLNKYSKGLEFPFPSVTLSRWTYISLVFHCASKDLNQLKPSL